MGQQRPPCYNHAPYKDTIIVPDGWLTYELPDGKMVEFRKVKEIPNRMSRECQQWREFGEAKRLNWNCDGCKHDPRKASDIPVPKGIFKRIYQWVTRGKG